MNSIRRYNKDNITFINNISLRNNPAKSTNNIKSIKASYNLRNKSRNYKYNLLLLTDSKIKDKYYSKKRFFNNSNFINVTKNLSPSFLNNSNKKAINKKDFYKKKIKQLLINI